MIDKKLLQSYSKLAIGEQINIDHEDCDAGVDRKKRLYIKHVVGGGVLSPLFQSWVLARAFY